MAIKYCSRLGYGFILDFYDIEELRERENDLCDDFLNNDYMFIIDSWSNDTLYFFGIIEKTIEPGCFYEIPAKKTYKSKEIIDMITKFKEYFPTKSDIPHDYLLSCID